MSEAPALSASDLRLRLGRTQVLRGVDLCVRPGDLYGLLGRNGAGKTTTMRCLLGFQRFDAGSATVFGSPAARISQVSVPIGVALDPPGLDGSLTLEQNLRLAQIRGGLVTRGEKSTGRGVDDVLELVGLEHRRRNRGGQLSHGQARRAAVARALLGDPRLIVLDEPLSGLDPEGVEDVLTLLRRLAGEESVTVLFSSHHLREVEVICNRVGLIEEGRVVLEGATRGLLEEIGDGVRVRCADPGRAQSLLAARPEVDGVDPLEDGELRLRVRAGASLAPLLESLASAGVGLEEFAVQRASLVDVFREALR